jgi:thiamine biosynthesis protein ThiI
MKRGCHHSDVDIILVRYAEVGLKSPSVRRYFESILVDNMLSALAAYGLEALVDNTEQGRIYVTTERIDDAVKVLSRVFGVASVSPALVSDSAMEEMQKRAAEYSRTVLKQRQSFAVKARREGNHPYKSMDVGREVGSAIFLANEEQGVKVNLSHPDVTFYVEVRGRRAFIFSEYVPGPGGLPLGSQGKVVAVVRDERDALAAWMLMKRGCRAIALAGPDSGPVDILRRWDPKMKVADGKLEKVMGDHKALAAVYGYGLGDMETIKALPSDHPSFFPLMGMSEDEIKNRLDAIKRPLDISG